MHAFLEAARGAFYLDTSGEPLFKRGWRASAGEAPLRENLAAGIVLLSGWKPEEPLLDPMCGGGTLLVEAAAMARGRAPGAQSPLRFREIEGLQRFHLGKGKKGIPQTPQPSQDPANLRQRQ